MSLALNDCGPVLDAGGAGLASRISEQHGETVSALRTDRPEAVVAFRQRGEGEGDGSHRRGGMTDATKAPHEWTWQDLRMVHVKWIDSTVPTGRWLLTERLDAPEVGLCESVGFLLPDEHPDILRIAQAFTAFGEQRDVDLQLLGISEIPRVAIHEIHFLCPTGTADPRDRKGGMCVTLPPKQVPA